MGRKGNPIALLVRTQIGTVTMEKMVEVPQKIKNRTTAPSSNITSGYLCEKIENSTSKRYMCLCALCNVIYSSQGMKAI